MREGEKGQMAREDREERQAAKAERQAAREERRNMREAMVEDPQVRAKAEDFVTRYTSGNPYEDYDEDEAVEMFEMVRAEATPEELREALAETIKNFTPEQKAAFAAALQGGADAGEGHGAMGLKAGGGDEAQGQRMGLGGGLGDLMAGAGQMQQRGGQPQGGVGMDDMLGGLLGGLLGGGMAGGMPGGGMAQMQNPAQSPFGSLLGGLLGSAGQPMQQRPQAGGGDPIGSLLGGLLGSGAMKSPQGFGQMPGQQAGGDPLSQILGGLLGGGAQAQQRMPMPKQDPFAQMFGGQMPQQQMPQQQQQGGMNSALMKMLMGGMAAFAMKKVLSGGR
jgi:hypothetical protein